MKVVFAGGEKPVVAVGAEGEVTAEDEVAVIVCTEDFHVAHFVVVIDGLGPFDGLGGGEVNCSENEQQKNIWKGFQWEYFTKQSSAFVFYREQD
jgi:hypothetical protein